MRFLVFGALLILTACQSGPLGPGGILNPEPGPAPLPQTGPIAYRCTDGTQLMIDVENSQARVSIVGGPSMVLPSAAASTGPYYTNGRYGVRGSGADVQWEAGRSAPVSCHGG
jgi:membrane-bound inhibitor of C-type lysozyme